MYEISFYLSSDDMDRLFIAKERAGKNHLTGNDFARELLEQELYHLCPKLPTMQEEEEEEDEGATI